MDRIARILRFTVTFSQSVRVTLDTAAIRSEMGGKWCDDRSKLAEVAIPCEDLQAIHKCIDPVRPSKVVWS